MGQYINLGNSAFRVIRNGEYVDKSPLISVVNNTLLTERGMSCVTQCRRFGKSMAAKMLCAYYDKSCDSRELFADLKIAKDPTFEQHLNKYSVIYLDITGFTTRFHGSDIVTRIDAAVKADIHEAFPQIPDNSQYDLMDLLCKINEATGEKFVFIIDEWDAVCREFNPGTEQMNRYLNWLRRMFKDVSGSYVFAGVYMTGILPIKKYKTESALNNFIEYSMVSPKRMAGYFGFTKDEVSELAEKHGMSLDDLENWYDGYKLGNQESIFNPNSIMQAVYNGYCESYWGATGSFEAVAEYIQMNFDGLKDDIIRMLAGETVSVDPTGFQNDLSAIKSKDDVLTVLIHLGYLAYNREKSQCYIPNREVAGEMVNAVRANKWKGVAEALESSRKLLEATLRGDEGFVARAIDAAHDDNTSILSYNDENSLACVLSIAYYYARNNYVINREMATGKGFADLVLIPRKEVDSPAVVIELKFNKDTETAIAQIKRRNYPSKVEQYADNLLLVGINYDKESKKHSCHIEKYKL